MRSVDQLAVYAGPKPLSFFCSHEPSKLLILAGIQRTKAMSAVLIRKMMAWVILAVILPSSLDRLINSVPDLARVIGYQSVGSEPQEPVCLIYAVDSPRVD